MIVFITILLVLSALISFMVWAFHSDPVTITDIELVQPEFPSGVAPLSTKTSHLHMVTMSPEHTQYMSHILGLTKLWFEWATIHGIRTSLQGGSVIGYAIAGAILPHDDDIDVSMHYKDLPILHRLWTSGKRRKVRMINHLFWDVHEVTLQPMNITIRVAKARRYDGWYKWLPQSTYHPIDIGGLDIMNAVPQEPGDVWYEMAKRARRLPSQENLIPITFNGFPAYIAQDTEVFEYLKERYGTRWITEMTDASPYNHTLID